MFCVCCATSPQPPLTCVRHFPLPFTLFAPTFFFFNLPFFSASCRPRRCTLSPVTRAVSFFFCSLLLLVHFFASTFCSRASLGNSSFFPFPERGRAYDDKSPASKPTFLAKQAAGGVLLGCLLAADDGANCSFQSEARLGDRAVVSVSRVWDRGR